MQIGIVGLGVMGSATGGHLMAAGHHVGGFDPDHAAVERFAAAGGELHGSVTELAEASDVILVWIPSVDALVSTTEGIALVGHRSDDTAPIVVEMGTLPLSAKRSAAEVLSAEGISMLDAPVSGTGQQAVDATLVILGSGEEAVFRKVEPIFEVLGTSRYLGPFGHGSVMKYIANLLVTVQTLAAAEAHALGAAAGLDPSVIQAVIASGVGSSRMWEIRGSMMATDTYAPPAGRLDIIKKDAGIIAEYAGEVGSPIPLLQVALDLFRDASDAGLGSLDAAAIRRYLDLLE